MKATAVEVVRRFRQLVNMPPGALRAWLATPQSRSVGFSRSYGSESVGHRSGRRIVEILEDGDRSPEAIEHMRKVVGYISRHLAQRPSGDVSATRWRYSLMNWGHDPLKSRSKSRYRARPRSYTSRRR